MSKAFDIEHDRVATEAATWLVLLSESDSDSALAAEFDAWRRASPLHAELWERTARAHQLAGKMAPHFSDRWPVVRVDTPAEIAPAGTSAVLSRSAPTIRRRHPRRLALAGLSALAAGLLLLAAPELLVRFQADHRTATAQLRSVVLEDGTQVRLGPESALAVDFSTGSRGVRLLKGEAFFDVVPDAGRPFRVSARGVSVTVLGTAFEVRLEADDVAVAVRHGRVRVDGGTPQRSEQLGAGQWTAFQPAAVERGQRNVEEIGDWLNGELIARDRPVTEIVDALRRYFGGRIIIDDDAFARTRVTGIYDLRHPEATLASLAASHGSSLRRLTPWFLVVTSR